MSQQINLVNLALIKKKPFLTLNSMAVMLAVMLLILIGYYTYLQKEVSTLSTQRQQMANDLVNAQNSLKALALLHAPQEIDTSLEKQIAQLEQKVKVQQQILTILGHSTNTPDNSYAALMRALARQSIEGLWLTSFSVDSQTDTLNIQGRALQGDLVPQYIKRLSNEPALKGKLFSGLSISLPKVDAVTDSQSTPNTTPQIQSNQIDAVTEKTNTQRTLTAVSLPNYIEFSLESKLDSTSTPTANNQSNTTNLTLATGDQP